MDLPLEDLSARALRAADVPVVLGGTNRRELDRAWQLGEVPLEGWALEAAAAVDANLEPEATCLVSKAPPWDPLVGARGAVGLSGPDGAAPWGDLEPGLVSGRMGGEALICSPWVEARLGAQVRLEAGTPELVGFAVPTAWVGLRHGPVRAGFGIEPRELGPARRGALVLGDAALPFPAGSVSVGRLAWRVEAGAGWLQAPRSDVQDPGLLWMDARWAPVPWVELGGSRLSMFAGEGRPWPGVLPLIIPVDPHVEGDPDRELADQNELVALDIAVRVPIPGDDTFLEVYSQYGGEDMVLRPFGPIERPTLAGVANVAGAELGLGPLVLTGEWSRLMDDTFRWYVGHRVYHQGFTQDGVALGHPNGGDQRTIWGRAGYSPGPWGADLWVEQVHAVQVYEVLDGTVITGVSDLERIEVGSRFWWLKSAGGGWSASASLAHAEGAGFVPGAEEWAVRVSVQSWGMPWVLRDPGDVIRAGGG